MKLTLPNHINYQIKQSPDGEFMVLALTAYAASFKNIPLSAFYQKQSISSKRNLLIFEDAAREALMSMAMCCQDKANEIIKFLEEDKVRVKAT